MVVGDKVRVIDKLHPHGLDIGDVVNILLINSQDGTIKTDDPSCELTWWLWEGEFELLNQEQ